MKQSPHRPRPFVCPFRNSPLAAGASSGDASYPILQTLVPPLVLGGSTAVPPSRNPILELAEYSSVHDGCTVCLTPQMIKRVKWYIRIEIVETETIVSFSMDRKHTSKALGRIVAPELASVGSKRRLERFTEGDGLLPIIPAERDSTDPGSPSRRDRVLASDVSPQPTARFSPRRGSSLSGDRILNAA